MAAARAAGLVGVRAEAMAAGLVGVRVAGEGGGGGGGGGGGAQQVETGNVPETFVRVVAQEQTVP